eukprot:1563783-Amphidinium_carterae.1
MALQWTISLSHEVMSFVMSQNRGMRGANPFSVEIHLETKNCTLNPAPPINQHTVSPPAVKITKRDKMVTTIIGL